DWRVEVLVDRLFHGTAFAGMTRSRSLPHPGRPLIHFGEEAPMTDRRSALIAGLAMAAAPALPLAAQGAARIVADEFWADKNGVKLWVYRKRLEGATPKAKLFCVHGSSYSGKTMFDLQVPDREGYSMMDHVAGLGYEVWAMDHEGCGHSDRTPGNSDIQPGVHDLEAAMAVVRRESRVDRLSFFGHASGVLRAARFAMQHPQHVQKL